MKKQAAFILSLLLLTYTGYPCKFIKKPVSIPKTTDSLPRVFSTAQPDFVAARLRKQAAERFSKLKLPGQLSAWYQQKKHIRAKLIEQAAVKIDHQLPLQYREHGILRLDSYSIKNITFQTRRGVFATANLYVPNGKGPFPAIIVMNGHWPGGRLFADVKALAQTFALNGFVCLALDAWGAGERATALGHYDYHGGNLGASLMNIGESLLGSQLADNIRAVDLLESLPYVDHDRIGATGASGGGNQTMWLAASDERIKAAMPVVSSGTFQAYIMGSNCVCELCLNGLTFTEESGIIATIAPRAVHLCSGTLDQNPAFFPAEMLRSYEGAKGIFQAMSVPEKLSYRIFNSEHGYFPEIREHAIVWFTKELKNKASQKAIVVRLPKDTISTSKLLVYPSGKRDVGVISIGDYCVARGKELRKVYLRQKNYNAPLKVRQLITMLHLAPAKIDHIEIAPEENGWKKICIESIDSLRIPLLLREPVNPKKGYCLVLNPNGKAGISESQIKELLNTGNGIVIADLMGCGEAFSTTANQYDKRIVGFHTIARSEIWLGKTVIGEWVRELNLISGFLKSQYHATQISIDATHETCLAALFYADVNKNIKLIKLRNAPLSYQFDQAHVDYFNMAVHVPNVLKWGDISLAAALTGSDVVFINPVSISGKKPNEENMKRIALEFKNVRKKCKQAGSAQFIYPD